MFPWNERPAKYIQKSVFMWSWAPNQIPTYESCKFGALNCCNCVVDWISPSGNFFIVLCELFGSDEIPSRIIGSRLFNVILKKITELNQIYSSKIQMNPLPALKVFAVRVGTSIWQHDIQNSSFSYVEVGNYWLCGHCTREQIMTCRCDVNWSF